MRYDRSPARITAPKAPSMYFSKSWDILFDLHVDDGYVAGPKEKQEKLYRFLEKYVANRRLRL